MVEPAACVGGGDAVEGGGEGGFERFGRARLGGPQRAVGFGPAGFNRREAGRVTRQVEELEPGLGKGRLDSLRLWAGKLSMSTVALGWRRRRSGTSTARRRPQKPAWSWPPQCSWPPPSLHRTARPRQ